MLNKLVLQVIATNEVDTYSGKDTQKVHKVVENELSVKLNHKIDDLIEHNWVHELLRLTFRLEVFKYVLSKFAILTNKLAEMVMVALDNAFFQHQVKEGFVLAFLLAAILDDLLKELLKALDISLIVGDEIFISDDFNEVVERSQAVLHLLIQLCFVG